MAEIERNFEEDNVHIPDIALMEGNLVGGVDEVDSWDFADQVDNHTLGEVEA